MQNEILAKNPQADVRVYAVWLPMLAGDSAGGWDPRVLNDPRVTNYWDPDRSLGVWAGQRLTHSNDIVWDHYFLFGPDAVWKQMPGPLLGDGGDVIGESGRLQTEIRPFL